MGELTSRERVALALAHREPDRIPLDLGGTMATGMHVSTVYKLRQALGLDAPGIPIKVIEPYQMLGEIGADLVDVLDVDVVELPGLMTGFGFPNEGWRDWATFDGTPVLVPAGFNIDPEPNGDILMYPEGDKSVPASGRMPQGGWYFDAIMRQSPFDEEDLKVEDNLEEYQPIDDSELESLAADAERLHTQTDKAVVANFGFTDFSGTGAPSAMALKYPRGIRDIEEWFVSLISRRDHMWAIFDGQCEIALANLARIDRALGDRIQVICLSFTDFGAQLGPFISPQTYLDLYQPFHRRLNDWIHENTNWKTFIHSCGSVVDLLDAFIDAGFDILNPVQTSAAGMDPAALKRRFGHKVTFWGGGVDTQHTLPFGSPDDVRREVHDRLRTFGPGGG